MRNKEPLLGFEVCVVLCRFDGYCRIVSMRERVGWVGGRVSMQDTMQCTAHSMQGIIQRILCGVSMHCMVLYEGQLTDHSHPRLPSQGRATRSHPHLGDVALVKKKRRFFSSF